MNIKYYCYFLFCLLISGCISIPKETVDLSQAIGVNLDYLHTSNRNLVVLYYSQIKSNINIFIDDVYAPFLINNVLKQDEEHNKEGKGSLHGALEAATESGNKEDTAKLIEYMDSFIKAAHNQIVKKRNELLGPIIQQEQDVLKKVDESYKNLIYANATITGHLKSIRKVKDTQEEALNMIGLRGLDTIITNKLVKTDSLIKIEIENGKKIDLKSDDAIHEIEDLTKKIKDLINNK